MKYYTLLFAFVLMCFNLKAQFVDIQINKLGAQNNVNACKVDTFQLTVTPAGPLTGNLTMTLKLYPNEEVFAPFISTSSGVPTMNFGNNLSASTHTFLFYLKINCDAIPDSTSFVTYTDSANLFLNSISYNLSDWQIKNPNQHEFIYQWGFPSLDITTNQNISVDFIDVYNSDSIPIVRTIQYINNGVAPGDFFGKIKYADSINCSEVIVDSIRIFVDTVEILPMTSVNSNSFTTAEILCSIPLGSMLIIKEVLAFPNFMDTCINTCTASNLRFNNLLSWGCDSSGSSNLCRTVSGQANVQTGTKNPQLTINRIAPLPSGNAPDFNYWDAGTNGSPVHWQFLITNTGDDVAKDVLIRLWNQFPKSLYYIEEDSIHVTFASPHENIDTISTFASILLASRFSTDSPACLINFTKPIIDKSYTLNYLFPSESVLIEFTTRFCCPESDDGTNNHINRFNDPKTFNTWQFEIKGRDECGITTNCPNATTTDTSISRYEVTTYISPNSGYTGIHLYLDQEHIPPASNGLDAAPGGCSGTKVFELRNNLFNLQTSTLDFLQSDANFFSNTYHNDPDSMIVSAIVRFQFELEQGLYLDTIDSSFVFQSGTSVLWPVSTVQKVVHTNCTGKDVYQADFNITDLPTGSSLTSFYSFMNSSTLRFKLYGCCCYAANTNPEYTVKTLLSGLNSSCFVPMTEKSGGTFIHCQGCQVPGIIVNETDSILYRTTLGWADMDNDGILNTPAVRASSNIKINQSIVGDTLESIISASISSIGSGGCSIDSLQAMNIDLNKLYLEAKIDNSDTTRFNLNLISIQFTIYPYNSSPFLPVTVTPSNTTNWNALYYDYRNAMDTSGSRKGIIFLNLSESVLHSLDPALSTYSFHEGDKFDLILKYQVCGNYHGSSSHPDDNRFISNVAMNMYLTAVDLPSLGIYSAYSDHNPAYPTAVNCVNPQSNWLYNCQTANGTHTFYSVRHYLIPAINDSYTNPGPDNSYNKCHKSLLITSEVVIGGGDLYNVFPNEFRAVPPPIAYQIHLPPANSNYTLQQADKIGSRIRTYNEFGCLPYNKHLGIFNTGIINVVDSQITFNSPIAFIDFNENMTGLYSNSNCDAGFDSIPNLLSGDEYLYLSLNFPFVSNNCPFEDTTLNNHSILASMNFNNCSQSIQLDTIERFESSHNTILAPDLSGFIDFLPLSNISVNTSSFCFDYQLKNIVSPTEDNAENAFIIIPNPGIFSDIMIDTVHLTAITYTPLSGISTPAFLFRAGNVDRGSMPLYSICCTLDSCIANVTIPIYYGWNCSGYPTGNIVSHTDLCFDTTDNSLTLNFADPVVTSFLEPIKPTYTLCQPDTFYSSLSVTQAGIHNINFNIFFNSPDLLALNQLNFDTSALAIHYHDGPNVYPLSYSTSLLTLPDTGYQITINNQSLPDSNLLAGDFISISFVYVPTTVYTGGSPFTIQYTYSNYCDNILIPDSIRSLNQWTWSQLDDCTLNFTVLAGSSNNLPCSGGSFQLYSQLTGAATGIPPYTYTWTSIPPLSIPQVQNPVISGLHANTTFIVTITDSVGKTGTDTIIINPNPNQCCTPASFNPVLDYDFSRKTASAVINDPIHPASQPFTTGQLILINDTFTVDVDFNFTSCQNIILGPGAVIDVLPGVSLSVFYSTIHSCDEMARGIIAESGSIVSLKNAFIYDCQYGIEARDKSTVYSEESYFTNDYVGIYYSPVGSHSPNIHVYGQVISTEFSSTYPLKQKYRGQFPDPLTMPFAGVLMDKVATINFGNFNKPANRFIDLNFGFHATSSNLNVRNCYFRRIKDYDAYQAFNMTRGSAIFIDGRQGVYQLHQHGKDESLNPEFIECFTGINSLACGVTSWGNYMENCDDGYRLFGGMNLTFRIFKNHIDFNVCGIASLFNNASIIKEISENVLTGGRNMYRLRGNTPSLSHPYGITIADGSTYNYGGTIGQNFIDIHPQLGGLSAGISLTGAGTYKVLDNFIILENDNPVNASGIFIQNSRYNNIECNKVYGTDTNQIYLENDIAMKFSKSPSNYISCNSAENTSIGYQFTDNCLDGANNPTIFRTNDFGKKHFRGLYYSASARVDRQPFKGNTWFYNNYPEYGARNDNPVSVLNDQYDVEQGVVNNLPIPLPGTNGGWFNILQGRDENCDLLSIHHGLCYSTQNPQPVPSNFSELIRIARDSSQSIEFDEQARWKAKVELYEKLMQVPAYLDSSTELANFYISYAGSVIQKIAQLNIERNELFSNQGTLVSIMQANALEIYYKSELIEQYDNLLQSGGLSEVEKDSILLAKNAIIQGIRSIISYNTLAFQTLDSTLNIKADLLNGENQAINSIEIIELNEKIVNEVYYNTIAKNRYELIFNYAASLLNVAMQCPLSGGSAVYRARALYFVIDPDMVYDDELTCLQSGYLYKTSKNIKQKSKLYPNPASNDINLIYNITENARLEISDQFGRVFHSHFLSKELFNFSFPVSGFENGIYNYRIVSNENNLIDVGQFIVIK